MTSKTNNISKDVGCGSDRVFRTISTVLHTEVSKTIVKGWGYRIQYKGCFHKKKKEKRWVENKTGGLNTTANYVVFLTTLWSHTGDI